jgi:hypothetical protein
VDTKEHNILIYSNYYGGSGVAVGDFNNDGLLDIYFAGNLVADRLYQNLGNLKFKDITEESAIQDNGGWSSGVLVGDVNNDGWSKLPLHPRSRDPTTFFLLFRRHSSRFAGGLWNNA